jgi:hypothetical protein
MWTNRFREALVTAERHETDSTYGFLLSAVCHRLLVAHLLLHAVMSSRPIKRPTFTRLVDYIDQEIPAETLATLKVGDLVKLHLQMPNNPELDMMAGGESFWVEITRVLKHGRFTGTVENHLFSVDPEDLAYGDKVGFHRDHVYTFQCKPEEGGGEAQQEETNETGGDAD